MSANKSFAAAQDAIRKFASASDFGTAATNAFGVDAAAVGAVILDFDRHGWPKLVLVDDMELNGARAAYDTARNTIYLSREFAASATPAAVTAALVEEIGHAIDARVHTTDAPGDEGQIFAAYVMGNPPSASELAALKIEDDHGSVTVQGKTASVEFAAPVAGSVTLDGNLSDWTSAQQVDRSLSTSGYDLYGKLTGGYYVFAIQAPTAVGANTTVWLNTDQNSATGYQIWGTSGGAEYNINFDGAGTPFLYKGAAGQTKQSAQVLFGYSADHKTVEFAVQAKALGSPKAINTLWDVNDNTYLPSDYSATQYSVTDVGTLPVRTDFSKHIGIVYSDTSAKNYWAQMSYAQLIMAAENQATMAGVRYDVLSEADLTNLSKLVNYDALVFPNFTNVQSTQLAAIEQTLTTLVNQYHVGLIAGGEFMTNDQNNASLPGDAYARMKSLLGVQPLGGGYPVAMTLTADDVSHPMMKDYGSNELIRSYTDAGWLAYAPTTAAGSDVLAKQTINGSTYDAVIETTTGGHNVHFSTDAVLADNNLLWQAIDYVVNGGGVTAGLQLSRNSSIVASRVDMDQAQEHYDVVPENGGPGIYDRLLPILAQWKAQYGYVGSYYIDIGNNVANEQYTDWAKSGQYYKQLVQMGNEIGSHSLTHPDDTNLLSATQIKTEFQNSRTIIEQQMSQILGTPYTVTGAAVPGAPETLATALAITQYYNYLSGGFSGVGAGYPGAIGYLNPTMAAANKPYIAPNVEFDFSLVEFKGMTSAQASAEWNAEFDNLASHADVPVIVWPWHDYGAADWPTNPPADSPYTTQMFTDFIARAYNAGAEFVTVGDLAQRLQWFHTTNITTSVSGSTVTAAITSPDAGKFALDLDNLGSQVIKSVANWYAYDSDSVFLPRNGGSYTINLGTAADDVTHIVKLPMRAELLSVSGNGSNLSFSAIGEGEAVIDLKNPSGLSVNVTGATVKSLVGDILTLDIGAFGQHDVSVTLSTAVANRAPVISSNGGADTATISIAENTTAVTTVTSTDADAGQTRTYSIVGGADAALFTITAGGVLSFASARNFEAAADADRNNSYIVQVRVADNGSPSLSDTQTITVNVTDINDNAPAITTAATQSVAENTTFVAALASTDADTVGTNPATFTITGGADAARFAVSGGNLVFVSAPDYENPGDSDRNNSYVVQVTASDGPNSTNKTITIGVTDVADTTANHAPVITSNGGGDTASINVTENTAVVTTVTATDTDAGQSLAYSIVGGADQALFSINASGALSFKSAPNFEAPADADHNNSYVVQVRVADNGSPSLADTQTITVNVTDVAEGTTNSPPVITSNGGGASAALSIVENASAVTTVTATDPNAGDAITYLISGGADAAKFAINATTGALTFITPPDFEAPTDQAANNVYDVLVGARDASGALDTQALAVTVTNANGLTVNGTASAETLNGTPEADTINGNDGNDVLNGLAGNDTLFGGNGADVLDGGPGADALHGGPGIDVFIWDPADTAIDAGNARDILRLTGSGTTIDLSQAIANSHIDGIGVVDLTGSGNNTANLSINDVFAMCWDNYLRFDGNAGDRVTVLDTANWARGADQVVGSNTYHVWSGSGATLLIDTDVTTNLA